MILESFTRSSHLGNIIKVETLFFSSLSLVYQVPKGGLLTAILELHQISEVKDLELGWNQLLSRCVDKSPFSTYEWLTLWWKHFGRNKELKFFFAEKEGKVSLAIPVMYSTCRVFGLRRCRVAFVASPDSDYQIFLVNDFRRATESLNELIESIMNDSHADCIVFSEVPEASATARLLENLNGKSFAVSSRLISSCPYVSLPNSFEVFLQSLGSNLRRNLKVWERQATKDYRVEFKMYDKVGTIKEAMTSLFELHQKRQRSVGNCGSFTNLSERNFHLDLAEAFAEKGWLALCFLTFNDKPVSTVYAYEFNGKLYAYLCGFDPEYAKYRPGYLAFKNIMRYATKKSLNEFDFLRGHEEYKSRWRTKVRNNLEFRIEKKGFKHKFYNWM